MRSFGGLTGAIIITKTRYALPDMTLPCTSSIARTSSLTDPHGRKVNSLRLSVTQRCDLSCPHCHREGQSPSANEMSVAEIERAVDIASSLGIRKIKITGGEPLMRKDIVEIVRSISPLVDEVSLTTNGSHLAELAESLKESGLMRVNVSLHTLDPVRYERLCGHDLTSPVMDGIKKAVSAGLNPVKVNMVVIKGQNEDEIRPMIDFCANIGATLQLIEYETDRAGQSQAEFAKKYYPLKEIEDSLAKEAVDMKTNELHRRRRYKLMSGEGSVQVEVVRPMHNTEFCSHCTRLRLSSDGRLKPCLLDPSGSIDILGPMRRGASDEEVRALFTEAVRNRKPYWR